MEIILYTQSRVIKVSVDVHYIGEETRRKRLLLRDTGKQRAFQ